MVYDVLITSFGGLARTAANSTKSRGSVTPGVAITTALMPPLYTTGFGLASGNLYYFSSAFYPYFINAVFAGLATFVVARLLKYLRRVFLDKQREKIMTHYVGIIVFFTTVPSLFLGYNLIRSSYFNGRVRDFASGELTFPNTQILGKITTDTSEKKEVKIVLIGQTIPGEMITNAQVKLPKYGLKDMHLVVQQGFGQEVMDINELKNLLMQDLYKSSEEVLRAQIIQIDSLEQQADKYQSYKRLTSELIPEMETPFPYIVEASYSNAYIVSMGTAKSDAIMLAYLKGKTITKDAERKRIKEWLSVRVKVKNIKLLIE